jgi:hypothetical protein
MLADKKAHWVNRIINILAFWIDEQCTEENFTIFPIVMGFFYTSPDIKE